MTKNLNLLLNLGCHVDSIINFYLDHPVYIILFLLQNYKNLSKFFLIKILEIEIFTPVMTRKGDTKRLPSVLLHKSK